MVDAKKTQPADDAKKARFTVDEERGGIRDSKTKRVAIFPAGANLASLADECEINPDRFEHFVSFPSK